MTDIKLPSLQKEIKLQSNNAREMLKRAYILNNTIDFDSDIYVKTAIMLSKIYSADDDTIIASLIYQYVKMSGMQDMEVKGLFNEEVLKKVTILKKLGDTLILNDKQQDEFVKTITKDVKVTIIKLVERLIMLNKADENSQNMDYIIEFIQKFDISICRALGIYKLKNAFENISFKYNSNYELALQLKSSITEESKCAIELVERRLRTINDDEKKYIDGIEFHVNVRSVEEVYNLFHELNGQLANLKKQKNIESSGICSIKCLVDTKNRCYHALYFIHQFLYQTDTFIDYLNTNVDNEYHAIHTKVFIKSLNKTYLVNFRICTKEMDRINNYGIASDFNNDMQVRLKNNYSFYNKLLKIMDSDNITSQFLEIVNNKEDKNDIKTYMNKMKGE